jgi:hypothetical protein
VSLRASITDLSTSQRKAVEALAAGHSVPVAAELAGVDARTVYRWKLKPGFSDALRATDAENLRTLARRLTRASDAAFGLLLRVIADEQASYAVRVRAAVAVLEQRAKFYELVNIQDDLDDLDARLQEIGA